MQLAYYLKLSAAVPQMFIGEEFTDFRAESKKAKQFLIWALDKK